MKNNDELNRTNYSLVHNIAYCVGETATSNPALIFLCAAAIVIGAALPVLTSYLPKVVIDTLEGGDLRKMILSIVLIMSAIALMSGANAYLRKYIYFCKYRMNTHYLKKSAMKGLVTDYPNQESSLFRRLQSETHAACSGNFSPLCMVYDKLISLGTALLGIGAYQVILAKLSFGVIFFIIVAAVGGYFLNRSLVCWTESHRTEFNDHRRRIEYISRVSGDVEHAKDVRLYNMTKWFERLYNADMKCIVDWYRKLKRKAFGVSICDSLFSLLREIVVYIYLIYLVLVGDVSVADFVLYVGAVAGFSVWLSGVFSDLADLSRISLSVNYYRSYLEYPDVFPTGGEKPKFDAPCEIELQNVGYRYEDTENFTLHGINLKIIPGERLAVVGVNGAGKSTLIKLICGFIDPTEGQVLYGGRDIRSLDRHEYYRLFSALFQQWSMLPVTLAEVVAECPAEEADIDRVRDCIIKAGIPDKLSLLSLRMGRGIYDDGIELSGGETQKLLLARALYRNAPVLILDEPTAALDPISESRLYENYSEISCGKTAIFVSHRLSSTGFCDRIVLIEDGCIAEEGTHKDLIALGGRYRELYDIQAKYYRGSGADASK